MRPARPPPPIPGKQSQKPIKKQEVSCKSCEGFLLDWLSMPPYPGHPWEKRLKWSVLKRISPWIAKELYRFLMTMSYTEEYLIQRTVQIRIDLERNLLQRGFLFIKPPLTQVQLGSLERLAWNTTVHAIVSQRGGKDLEWMLAHIQDSCMIVSKVDALEWLGYVIWTLWKELTAIHKEHTGICQSEGEGFLSIRASDGYPRKSTQAV